MIRRRTTEEFIKEAKEAHGEDHYDYSLVDYTNNRKKVKITCKIHNFTFEQIAHSHLIGKGCIKCANELKRSMFALGKEKFIERGVKTHGLGTYKYDNVVYVNKDTPVIITCPIHGDFKQNPHSHIRARAGCPSCNISQGERRVQTFLINNNIKFINEYTFEDCINIRKLPFDFYLPDYNICIEYDGKQHYIKVDTWWTEDLERNDVIKTKYCEDNGIKLIRIPYWDFDKIEEILTKELNIRGE